MNCTKRYCRREHRISRRDFRGGRSVSHPKWNQEKRKLKLVVFSAGQSAVVSLVRKKKKKK